MTTFVRPKEALVLAGGLGTRLRTVVSDVPKPMAPLGGRPFLEYLFDYWSGQGIRRFVVSVGYLGHVVSEHFGHSYAGTRIEYCTEEQALGTGGALSKALQSIPWNDEFLIVLNGDTWFNVDLSLFTVDAQRCQKPITVALKRIDANSRYGAVDVDNEMSITAFNVNRTRMALINSGCYLLSRKQIVTDMAQMPSVFSFENDFLGSYVEQHKVAGSIHEGAFIDIGVPEDYVRAGEIVAGIS